MKFGLSTISHLLVLVVECGMILVLLSFFLPMVATRDIDEKDHTVSYYSSHLISFCVDVDTEFTKHTCVYYSGNQAFFNNLPHFSSQYSCYLIVTVLTSFSLIFTVSYLLIELYGFFSPEDAQTGVTKNLSYYYDKLSSFFSFLPMLSDSLLSLIYGVFFSSIIGVFNLISLIVLIIGVSGSGFDDGNNLHIISKSLCSGFFIYLIGNTLLVGGIIGATLSRFFSGKIDESQVQIEPNPAFDVPANQ
ncbi:hypothetical protein EHI8A_027460 [Entamoeba histolytica HM-1:IMSS-B]|uniref:Uncharacterized protein n=6 Tax=Entamoeba histolytica TaxID=5759 RepID=B1N310_ENTH1|nr:hypothetical protein EHI_167090 [Entamoeba histolytica HM-1:IMSS]EMD44456.1 Hypothetical protein EHI5A_054270 [Entamoeba histolytica KU27]EMH74214.1 hypothetical protein EHI8A_027460 [Entamoeba histolytica HM-1:IMSS-B]EMS15819.1 hypothetical protein KM1_065310 [Entamoeba histolytica HM-3:IMSS]ENY65537.1 hypothetical protein EHI7A_030580 [Entamoeba histolytica HM-1:IMSS-A]GAT93796.1 hypothetical protein CL6EHI_167090 [Entamoeba histolytica]|eukprot:XP_001913576.1 hypothetical protein EHI_167090 [Entamoeba histolytica HM-1:IMSS]